jgi:hypothetical protein
VFVEAVERCVGDGQSGLVATGGHGQAADEDVEPGRGGGVVPLVGEVGLVDDMPDLLQRWVCVEVVVDERGFERAAPAVVAEVDAADVKPVASLGRSGLLGVFT